MKISIYENQGKDERVLCQGKDIKYEENYKLPDWKDGLGKDRT